MILETERLCLRRLQLDDALRMSEYRSKTEVKQYQSWNHYTIKDASKRISQCLKVDCLYKPRVNYHLGMTLKSGFLIGDLFVDIVNDHAYVLGYTLDSAYWHKGYALEMVSAFIDYMYENYRMDKVLCYVYEDNVRSVRLLKKLGFEEFERSYFYNDVGYVKVMKDD